MSYDLTILAGYKQIKCLLLTYTVFMFLLFVVMVVGGVLAYIFREQVENTIKAEMIADIRNYDPSQPDSSVTRAWDQTQSRLECCGLMTEQVRTGDTDMLTSVGLCQPLITSDSLSQPRSLRSVRPGRCGDTTSCSTLALTVSWCPPPAASLTETAGRTTSPSASTSGRGTA